MVILTINYLHTDNKLPNTKTKMLEMTLTSFIRDLFV